MPPTSNTPSSWCKCHNTRYSRGGHIGLKTRLGRHDVLEHRITLSVFKTVCSRKADFQSLSSRLLNKKNIQTAAMKREQTSIPIVYYNTGKCNYYRNDSVLAIIHKIAFYILIHYLLLARNQSFAAKSSLKEQLDYQLGGCRVYQTRSWTIQMSTLPLLCSPPIRVLHYQQPFPWW